MYIRFVCHANFVSQWRSSERFPKYSRFTTSMMSLIGFSLNYVFIKFAHIEFPLFKVSHYLHCTLRLLVIYFFFLYWACPLSNFIQVGEPNTPSCFCKHWECQSQVAASRGKDWTIYRRPFVRSTQIIFVIIGGKVSITNIILHLPFKY